MDQEKIYRDSNGHLRTSILLLLGFLLILVGGMFYKAGNSYLFNWLINRKLFFIAVAITIIPAFFKKHIFSQAAFVGFLSGLVIGEYYGVNPQGAQYGFGHFGWAIWLGNFIFSILMGIIIQRFDYRDIVKRTRKYKIWFAIFIAGLILIPLIIKLTIPEYTGD